MTPRLDLPPLIDSLVAFPTLLEAALAGVSPKDQAWRPSEEAWCLAEIVGHYIDCERDDFPTRVRMTLADPAQDWPDIDPQGAVRERGYASRPVLELLPEFRAERENSIAWLRKLDTAEWESAYAHRQLGVLRAGDLMLAWTAHDHLHLRQIAQRRFQLIQSHAPGFSTDYAGLWPG